MIVIHLPSNSLDPSRSGKFELRYQGKQWRDKAGHVWRYDPRSATLSSTKHGEAQSNQWKIENEIVGWGKTLIEGR